MGYLATVLWGGYELVRDNQSRPELEPESTPPDYLVEIPDVQRVAENPPGLWTEKLLFTSGTSETETHEGDEGTTTNPAASISGGNASLRLTAIVTISGVPRALIETRGSKKKGQLLTEGESIGEWKVDQISKQSVLVRSRRNSLKLDIDQYQLPEVNRKFRDRSQTSKSLPGPVVNAQSDDMPVRIR